MSISLENDMNIIQAAENIKQLYRTHSTNEDQWNKALTCFANALNNTSDPDLLEKCVLDDINWELSIDERILLLKKAKFFGGTSIEFLKDYYGFLAAHLDPSPQKENAIQQLKLLLLRSL